jgi:hypothetical protein
MSATMLARTFTRRAFAVERTLRTKVVPQWGALRFASTYYTPGECLLVESVHSR